MRTRRTWHTVFGALTGAVIAAVVASACAPAVSPGPSGAGSAAPSSAGATPAPVRPIRLVVDTDVAPDDVTAIASLLRDPAVELLAITVAGTGEAHCPGGMFVVRSIVTMLLDDPVPVACGPRTALGPAAEFPAAWREGADAGSGLYLPSPAFAPESREAQELLVELADAEAAAGGRLTILTLGTLTNLAAAAELDPTFASKVRVVSMLGAIDVPGNVAWDPAVAPTAEWNAHADPTAVRRVLEAGFDLTLIPLDATNSTPLTPALRDNLASDHTAAPADLVFELWSKNGYMTAGDYYLWDPLAAAALRDPSIVTTRQARLRVVEGAEIDGGTLLEDPAGAAVTIATGADRGRFEALLLERLRIGGPRDAAFDARGTVQVTAGDDRCDVVLDPPSPQAGLLRFDGTNTTAESAGIFVFSLGAVTWPEVEAFAAIMNAVGTGTPPSDPPAIRELTTGEIPAGGRVTIYGDAPAGAIGVTCLMGWPSRPPQFVLAGPFTIQP